MGNFLENVIDWGLSRERYWGTPLPIWDVRMRACARASAAVEELQRDGRQRPGRTSSCTSRSSTRSSSICPECGKHMKRVPEVIDCWYDSGSMPFAQWHYPV